LFLACGHNSKSYQTPSASMVKYFRTRHDSIQLTVLKSHDMKISNISFENAEQFKYLTMTVTNQI
jgi:hypothetical protein